MVKKKANTQNSKYFFAALYVLALIVLFLLFRPYLTALVLGTIIVIFFYPLSTKLQQYVTNKMLSSLIATLLVLLIILMPMAFIANTVAQEAISALRTIDELNLAEIEIDFIPGVENLVIDLDDYLNEGITFLTDYFQTGFTQILGGVVEAFVGLVLILFILYYGFKDGEMIRKHILSVLPVSRSHRERIREKAENVLYAVVYGQVSVALLQGAVGGLAFWLFGFNNPVFWAFVMAVLSFIPGLGTPIVWVPFSIIAFLEGDLVAGIGLAVVGVVIITNIDNLLKPRLIGGRSGMHPLLVIVSIFGGLTFFGLIGFILGPILVAICVLIIQFFNEEFGFD